MDGKFPDETRCSRCGCFHPFEGLCEAFLSYDDLVEFYKEFRKWPGHNNSQYIASNLYDALTQVPDTGDWHHEVMGWCDTHRGQLQPNRHYSGRKTYNELELECSKLRTVVDVVKSSHHGDNQVAEKARVRLATVLGPGEDATWPLIAFTAENDAETHERRRIELNRILSTPAYEEVERLRKENAILRSDLSMAKLEIAVLGETIESTKNG